MHKIGKRKRERLASTLVYHGVKRIRNGMLCSRGQFLGHFLYEEEAAYVYDQAVYPDGKINGIPEPTLVSPVEHRVDGSLL